MSKRGVVGVQALLIELLISGFFAAAYLKARKRAPFSGTISLRTLFALGRLERLKRWWRQWFSMALLVLATRKQIECPVIAEVKALAMFILAAPALKLPIPSRMRRV